MTPLILYHNHEPFQYTTTTENAFYKVHPYKQSQRKYCFWPANAMQTKQNWEEANEQIFFNLCFLSLCVQGYVHFFAAFSSTESPDGLEYKFHYSQ